MGLNLGDKDGAAKKRKKWQALGLLGSRKGESRNADDAGEMAKMEEEERPRPRLAQCLVGDLKKRLFWSGGALPEGHLEKAELVKAVEQAEAEKARRFAAQEEKRQQEAQGVLRPEPRPLDFETVPLADHEKQIVELHLLTEDELVDKILENGHDAPYDASKHYLVALCRKALKDPRAPKPKRERKVVEETEGEAITRAKRPTIGDRVQVRDTQIMKRYLPEAIGKVFRIIKDDGGAFPYRLGGIGEQRHWFSEEDICWPTKATKPTFVAKGSQKEKAKPDDQPDKVLINHNRYGCTQGEVREVLGETGDKRNWVLKGGRQVPKAHEGSGWSRVSDRLTNGPPPPGPPPPGPPVVVTSGPSEAEIFAEMEELAKQLEAQEAEQVAAAAPAAPAPAPATESGAPPAAGPASPAEAKAASAAPGADAAGAEARRRRKAAAEAKAKAEAEALSGQSGAPAAGAKPGEEKDPEAAAKAAAAGAEARRKRKAAAEAKAKAQAEAAERRKARRREAEVEAEVDAEVEEVAIALD
ncbi:unnamed protein product [Effrenium voratum]|nr:unnamed protein product [Effrenium voratum]